MRFRCIKSAAQRASEKARFSSKKAQRSAGAQDPAFWWKAHCKDFPVMGSLARDYLACAPSSATIERTFSAAARVCASGRSGLRIQTIERCISSHMWLRSSVRLGGTFTDCQAIIDAANKNPKFSKYQTKKVKKNRAIRD
ncbi:hypothetical protein Pst134EA_021116 [Puccinia striiformis f. sp. tritici]|uniref:hypothetical protein n=1 Tax=Puccinia striiformis f. sp. tritici TaxID=168172 RepID=UPI00200727BA|nr:hypothetical protein Pst134EA_021116 [Puccinia striiformis f. sp. tritici]KAH9457233.1 hypothetical protein Pst134EA_021116 [Puccinia striiformis f. sp. tritici]